MKPVHYTVHENGDMVDAVGVLDDARVFWAWANDSFLDDHDLSLHIQTYAEYPSVQDGEYGVEICESVEELRRVLVENEREDLLYLLEEPVFVVAGKTVFRGAHEKRATLEECAEMVRRDLAILSNVFALPEASERWDVSEHTLRSLIRRGKLGRHEWRKSGKTILVTRRSMERLFGKPKK